MQSDRQKWGSSVDFFSQLLPLQKLLKAISICWHRDVSNQQSYSCPVYFFFLLLCCLFCQYCANTTGKFKCADVKQSLRNYARCSLEMWNLVKESRLMVRAWLEEDSEMIRVVASSSLGQGVKASRDCCFPVHLLAWVIIISNCSQHLVLLLMRPLL